MSSAALCEALEYLMQVKDHQDAIGDDDWYTTHSHQAWAAARQAVEEYKENKKRE